MSCNASLKEVYSITNQPVYRKYSVPRFGDRFVLKLREYRKPPSTQACYPGTLSRTERVRPMVSAENNYRGFQVMRLMSYFLNLIIY